MSDHVGRDRRLQILVIDDDPVLLQLFGRVFRRLSVTMVAGALEALALLKEGETFDAILCDLHMPKMNGRAFFAALEVTDENAAQRVIFMTGGAINAEDELFLKAHPLLMKPFGLKDFEDVFARLPAVVPDAGPRTSHDA
jgi:CheY-like chemotaxis protein